jgi:hypothetical protein
MMVMKVIEGDVLVIAGADVAAALRLSQPAPG